LFPFDESLRFDRQAIIATMKPTISKTALTVMTTVTTTIVNPSVVPKPSDPTKSTDNARE
jgi:hypothetical protein